MTCLPNISISILRNIVFSLLLLATAQQASAQDVRKDALEKLRRKQLNDSIPFFRGFQIKADMVGLIQKMVSDYGQYEVGLRVNLKDKYFPVLELGIGSANHTNIITETSYNTSAPYGKIGADFNILKNKHDIYRMYVGARYAYTSFKFDIDHTDIPDPVWGGFTPFSHHDISASYHWIEALASVSAKIWGPLHLGWSARYKLRVRYNDGELGNVWYVPGYGIKGTSRLSGTFDVILEL